MYLFNLFGISRLFALYRSQSLLQFVIPFVIPFFNIPQQQLFSRITPLIAIFLLKRQVLIHSEGQTQNLQGELETTFLGLRPEH